MGNVTLNHAQQQAVDTIDGPLLVLAGPGTGKTQLLSARVASILSKTDTDAANILCLTFTESGAVNMRERLRGIIGEAAYDVTISTYHSFGSDIIKNYNQYFQSIAVDRSDDVRMERPIDELTRIQLIEHIVSSLPFDSPLLGARYYIKTVVGTISDLKRHLITPQDLQKLAESNLNEIDAAQQVIDDVVNAVGGISRKKVELGKQYADLLEGLSAISGDLTTQAAEALVRAHSEASEQNKTTPLTKWKNAWLHKNDQDKFTLTDRARSVRMLELAKIYLAYDQALKARAAYDFDDMILRAIEGIQANDELRFNLQERYQYILLDEFQDTNPSQFELVRQVVDHPVHEGRPNIMAVGDDDQAIFAFQGANVGNMTEFLHAFRDVTVINLTENYRSHDDVLHVADKIAAQISDRLHHNISHITKQLVASNPSLPKTATIERRAFSAEAAEYAWVAQQIQNLVSSGTEPSEIAVLAPKHRLLEGLVPFLSQANVPVAYEKRENILETEIIQGLRLAVQLLTALGSNDIAHTNQYFPQVLSLPYWQISPIDIWKTNWQYAKHDEERPWAEIALDSPALAPAVTFYLTVAASAAIEPLELTLDKLSGTVTVGEYTSPLRSFYFDPARRDEVHALRYYEAISHLSVIRAQLRDHQSASEQLLTLQDFLDFCSMYEAADLPLVNTHPIAQSNNAVQLMTAYKSKGLEFEAVFILQAHDDVWGKASTGGNNQLALPPNLEYIRYTTSSEDERLRLFFVALTRAKDKLFITSHVSKDTGKATVPLKYLAESDGISTYLPEHAQQILVNEAVPAELARSTETLWQAGQVQLPANFKDLVQDRLRNYRMSPTHLNVFTDMEHGGPEAFLVGTLLRFPQAPGAAGEYGTAIHNTLEWYQNSIALESLPSTKEVIKHFDFEISKRFFTDQDRAQAQSKGRVALQQYLAARTDMFSRSGRAEVSFYNEGVTVGEALLNGKIDRLEIDEQAKTVRIVDYKTGSPFASWNATTRALKYKQQLYIYKLLVENSTTWQGYTVTDARLEFVEPNNYHDGTIQEPLLLRFEQKELDELIQLIQAVWKRILSMELPAEAANFSKDYRGSQAFIAWLLQN